MEVEFMTADTTLPPCMPLPRAMLRLPISSTAKVLLTMRAMDEQGKWLPKSRKVYDLDENGERIRLASGRWKRHKEDTVDWNDQKYATNIFSSIFIIKTSFILSISILSCLPGDINVAKD